MILRDGMYYAGFLDGRPEWQHRRTPETQMDADTAEKVMQQLRGLGFVGMEVRLFTPRAQQRRKRQDADA